MPTKTELICKAISLGLTGYTGMNKADLEKFVNAAPKKSTSPEPAKKVKVKVKKPLAEQKKFKAGVAKVKETLAKGVVKSAIGRAVAKYKEAKAKEKAEKEADLIMTKEIVGNNISKYEYIYKQFLIGKKILKKLDYTTTVFLYKQHNSVSELRFLLPFDDEQNEKYQNDWNILSLFKKGATAVGANYNLSFYEDYVYVSTPSKMDAYSLFYNFVTHDNGSPLSTAKISTINVKNYRLYNNINDAIQLDVESGYKEYTLDEMKEERTKQVEFKAKAKEKAKELGNQVFGIRELAKEIGEFVGGDEGNEIKYIESERNEQAETAVALQKARVKSMKNEALKEYSESLINSGGILQIFDKSLSDCILHEGKDGTGSDYAFYGQWIMISASADNYVQNDEAYGSVVFSDTENIMANESGDPIDMEEAEKVFENFSLGWTHTTVPYKIAKKCLPEELDRYLEYARDEGELGENKVYSNYWVKVFGTHKEIAGDDAKFYKVYLKKKFNYDVDAKLKDAHAEKKAQRDEEKAKAKAKTTSKKETVANVGIPKGKKNAKIFTKAEYVEALKALGATTKASKLPEGARIKAYLARTKVHFEVLKD